jgi:hypothetical protein
MADKNESMRLYQIGRQGYWTGAVKDVPKAGHWPQGWTRKEIPTLNEGEYARYVLGEWKVTRKPCPKEPGPKPYARIRVELSDENVTPGETVEASADVRMSDNDSLVDVNTTYYVPVIDIDGRKADLLELEFVEGEASTSFSMDEKGIYTLDLNKIRPAPTAHLEESPELIVSSTGVTSDGE